MSQENVEIVRRAFEAFNRGDLDAAVVDLAADCEYTSSGAIPGTTDTYRGLRDTSGSLGGSWTSSTMSESNSTR